MYENKRVLYFCKDLRGYSFSVLKNFSVLVGKSSYRNSIMRAGRMTHQEKALVAKPEDLSLIPLNYNEEGERTDSFYPPPHTK